MDKTKCLESDQLKKTKPLQTKSGPKSKVIAKPKHQPKSQSKSQPQPKLNSTDEAAIRSTAMLFNPDAPDSYDFTAEEIRQVQLAAQKQHKLIEVNPNHPHEYGHLTEACGCVFNADFSERVIGCDLLLLEDCFLEAEQRNVAYPTHEKLEKVAMAIGQREALYPDDDNRRQQLETLWNFAYQLSCIGMSRYHQMLSANY